MGPAGNLALAVLGLLVEGGLLVWGACWVERRLRRQVRQRPVRAVATIRRPELPTPPRKELTR
jgi:hypothetical protein